MTNTINQASAQNYRAEAVYAPQSITLNKSQRLYLNQKVLGLQNSTSVYNLFTGKGGLHSFKRYQFPSYYQYSHAKQKLEYGQFLTPDPVCQTIVEMLEIEEDSIVADICSGKGSFFNYLKHCRLYGVEKEREAYLISKRLFPKANIQNADMRTMKALPECDYIVGNPPFDIPFYLPNHPFSVNGKVLSQSFYLGKCFKSLKAGAFLGFVCPYFRTPRKMTANHKVKKFFWENFNVIAVINLPKGVFRENGTNIQTKVLILQKKPVSELHVKISFFQTTFNSREQVLKEWRESEQYLYFQMLKQSKI